MKLLEKAYVITLMLVITLLLVAVLIIKSSDDVHTKIETTNSKVNVSKSLFFADNYLNDNSTNSVEKATETTELVVMTKSEDESIVLAKGNNDNTNKNKKAKSKKSKKKKKKNRWNLTLSEYEISLIEQITWLESGNQCDKGQQAVIEVILNRVSSNQFPNSVVDVLSQRNQFTTWNIRSRARVTKQVKRNVKKVLAGKTNVLPKSTIYFSRAPMNSRIQAHIQDHYFCNR